jgi:hypothetical protein
MELTKIKVVIFGVENAQTVLAHHRKLYSHVTKKQITCKDKMTSSNNYKLYSKCYLKFFKIVPVKMESYKHSYAFKSF